ncbi:MiaB/RimO family radical SAM methylthiotransferase [Candidatus Falkowbacteria bacterium]|nr:MiaB/RimO family radical SAM methylthiotransferase [Candidatus Falkowbacteria bacterium]
MKTYHIITIGCQMNKSDSERLASILEKNGYRKTDNKYKADLITVNTCGVRQMAEDRIYGLIPEIKRKNKKAKIILTGCLVNRKDVRRRLEKYVDIWMMITEMTNDKFPMTNQCQISNVKYQNDYLKIVPKYESKFSAYVPIGNGCDNFCSYCVVPYARGREVYRLAKDIVDEAKNLVNRGYKEIILIAQNVNSYKSGKIDFADLLKQLDNIKGDFWLRFITSHPKDMSDKLIKTIAGSKNICRHIHLPVQAGDDKVLNKMNRQYARIDYIKLVKKVRQDLNDQFPIFNDQKNTKLKIQNLWKQPVAITTDIIVGFPGETKKQFDNSAKLMKEVKFDLAYIVRYSPRPGTAAFKMADNVTKLEKKRREEKLMEILRKTALDNNKKYIGKIVKVLVEGKDKRGKLFGSTETAKVVKISNAPCNDKLIGEFADVKIIKVMDFGLEWEIA